MFSGETNYSKLGEGVRRLRGNSERRPDASIIIPVNARNDLQEVLNPLSDIIRYSGHHTAEVILIINNFPVDNPPSEIEEYRSLGINVVSTPSARRPGEAVYISARALGVQAAQAEVTVHFDADCQISNITALLDWYITVLTSGASLAYTFVGFHDLRKAPSVHVRIAVHHTVRWLKRNLLGIPTARGSNYAINRTFFLNLYNARKLCHDIQLGMSTKLTGARIAYSGCQELKVLTSGRRFQGGWFKMFRYFRYRLFYNLKAIPNSKKENASTEWEGFDRESAKREAFVHAEAKKSLSEK